MKRYIGILILCVAALAAAGCGGTGTGQQSSVNFDMAILGVEGESSSYGEVLNELVLPQRVVAEHACGIHSRPVSLESPAGASRSRLP